MHANESESFLGEYHRFLNQIYDETKPRALPPFLKDFSKQRKGNHYPSTVLNIIYILLLIHASIDRTCQRSESREKALAIKVSKQERQQRQLPWRALRERDPHARGFRVGEQRAHRSRIFAGRRAVRKDQVKWDIR